MAKQGLLREVFKEEKVTDQVGQWVSILDYAHLKSKSISTIRRSIKANLIKYKQEDGKYFIFCNSNIKSGNLIPNLEQDNLFQENVKLKDKVRKLIEENSELKMLVKLYEDQNQLSFDLPKLPDLPMEM